MRYNKRRTRFKKRFKRKKHVLEKRWFWYLILGCAVFVGLGYSLFFSSIFRIEKIDITGVSGEERDEVQNIIDKRLKENFLFFIPRNTLFLANNEGIINDILQDFSEIEQVSAKKDFPSGLSFDIKKRQGKGFICQGKEEGIASCFLIDSQGIIFGEQFTLEQVEGGEAGKDNLVILADDLPSNLFEPGSQVIVPEKTENILLLYDKLENRLKIPTVKFVLKQAERVDVETKDGWQIYFSLDSDLNLALTKLGMLLEKEIPEEQRKNLEYVDLRFSKAYYK